MRAVRDGEFFQSRIFSLRLLMTVVAIVTVVLTANAFAEIAKQKSFASPEEAVAAAIAAAKSDDDKQLLEILGEDAKDVISSGDAVVDKTERRKFLEAYDEKHQLVKEDDKVILEIGKQDWPYPIPVVKKGDEWVFDTTQGREELLDRRIGENELSTIQVMLAIVDAQREYVLKDRNRSGLLEYAQKFISDPGKKNGLYWKTQAGEDPSPLGPLVAQARSVGYQRQSSNTPSPYFGYCYKILTAQGKDAPGGAYSYLAEGKMIGGFAVVAYPAEYGNSGIMTFIVNHDGKVFQKNLGTDTTTIAENMKEYNPDSTWTEVQEQGARP